MYGTAHHAPPLYGCRTNSPHLKMHTGHGTAERYHPSSRLNFSVGCQSFLYNCGTFPASSHQSRSAIPHSMSPGRQMPDIETDYNIPVQYKSYSLLSFTAIAKAFPCKSKQQNGSIDVILRCPLHSHIVLFYHIPTVSQLSDSFHCFGSSELFRVPIFPSSHTSSKITSVTAKIPAIPFTIIISAI